jgi:hypothetical protein
MMMMSQNQQLMMNTHSNSSNMLYSPQSGGVSPMARMNPKSDLPYDTAPMKAQAEKLFLSGMTRNHYMTAAEAEQKEKHVLKKIKDKQKQSKTDGWTEEQLQELLHS